MNVLYLILIAAGCSAQRIARKPYTIKNGGRGSFAFSLMSVVAALLFFVVSANGFQFNIGILPYAALFALSYGTATVCTFCAISCGPLSLSGLLISYSLLLPTVYGLIFLHDPVSVWFYPGIALLMVSLFLLGKKNDKAPITFKWVVFVFLAFVGNGFCTIAQKMEQVAFDGAYKNEFMIVALAMVVLAFGMCVLFSKERCELKTYVKTGWHLALACGVANGIVNLLVMVLSNKMPAALMFPLISAGDIVITYFVSRFLYKEKLSAAQQWSLVLGIGAIVFLNL